MKRLWLSLLACLSVTAFATTYRALSLETMLSQADLGFYGEVTGVSVEDRSGEPWTVVTFQVLENLKGSDLTEGAEDGLSLTFLGGTLPSGESLSVSLMPQFSVGEQVVVLAYERELYSPIVGFRQGLWRDTELGLRDETGRLLSLNEDDELTLDGEGGATEVLLERLKTALEEAQ